MILERVTLPYCIHVAPDLFLIPTFPLTTVNHPQTIVFLTYGIVIVFDDVGCWIEGGFCEVYGLLFVIVVMCGLLFVLTGLTEVVGLVNEGGGGFLWWLVGLGAF